MLKRAESRTHQNHFWQKKSSPSHLGSFQVDAQPPHMIASSHQNESSLNVFLAISVPTRIVIICMRWCVNDTSPVVTFLSSLKKDSTSLLGTFFVDLFPKVLHAQFLRRTHQLWQLAKSFPSTSATLVHHHPTSRIGLNALFTKRATNSLKPKVHVTSSIHSHFFSPCIYYVRNLDETPRVNLFILTAFTFGVTK